MSKNDHPVIRDARVLDAARRTALDLLRGEAKWLRNGVASLFENMGDTRMLAYASTQEVVAHAASLGHYLEQLKERNDAMERLSHLAEALGVWNQWPAEIEVVIVFKEKVK